MTSAQDEKRKITLTLLAFWPIAGESKAEMQQALTMFDTALEGISPRFVEMGARAFMQGRVGTHNPSFRPKPTELASYCRPMQENENNHAAAFKARQAQLAAPDHAEPTEADKARVQAQLNRARAAIASKVNSDMIVKINAGRSQ